MKSFVEYDPDCEFPIENLPYGIFSTRDNVSFMFCIQRRCQCDVIPSRVVWQRKKLKLNLDTLAKTSSRSRYRGSSLGPSSRKIMFRWAADVKKCFSVWRGRAKLYKFCIHEWHMKKIICIAISRSERLCEEWMFQKLPLGFIKRSNEPRKTMLGRMQSNHSAPAFCIRIGAAGFSIAKHVITRYKTLIVIAELEICYSYQ